VPKFLFTVIIATLLVWTLFITFILKFPPENFIIIFAFLILMYFCLSLTLSIPLYFYKQNRTRTLKPRQVYRFGVRWGSFFSIIITGIAGMRAFRILNLLNINIFTVFIILLYIRTVKQKQKTR